MTREVLPNILPPWWPSWPALRLRLPDDQLAFLPRPWVQPPTADWVHGAGERDADHLWRRTLAPGGRISLLTVGGQLRRRLAHKTRPAGGALSSSALGHSCSRSEVSGSRARATSVVGDRPGHRPHASTRRGAGPDRRVRCRQVDDRPRRIGYARPGCRITGGPVLFDGKDLLGASALWTSASSGARIAYVAQSAVAAFNPAHRLIDQSSETALTHRLAGQRAASASTLRPAQACPTRRSSAALPAPGLGRPAAARDDRDGDGACRPDLIVFDEPTTALDVTTQIEVLAAIKDAIREEGTAALYITTTSQSWRRSPTGSWCCSYGMLVEEGPTGQILHSRARPTRGSGQRAPRRGVAKVPRAAGGSRCASTAPRPAPGAAGRHRAGRARPDGRRGRRSVLGKSTLARMITGLLPPLSGRGSGLAASGCRARSRHAARTSCAGSS